jgi:hypothetical protein
VGVPQVVLPLFSFDQFVNAERVADVGVGLQLVDDARTSPALVTCAAGACRNGRLGRRLARGAWPARLQRRAEELALQIKTLPVVDACVRGPRRPAWLKDCGVGDGPVHPLTHPLRATIRQ